jgi:hypothetical protein
VTMLRMAYEKRSTRAATGIGRITFDVSIHGPSYTAAPRSPIFEMFD